MVCNDLYDFERSEDLLESEISRRFRLENDWESAYCLFTYAFTCPLIYLCLLIKFFSAYLMIGYKIIQSLYDIAMTEE